jgi:hypothetical protein
MAPRARAVAMANAASTTSWVVKALVEATPISVRPGMQHASDSRPMVLPAR